MGIPVRMNLISCKYKPLALSLTATDPDYDEVSVGQEKVYGSEISIQAQVVWKRAWERDLTSTGDPSTSEGHLTVKKKTATLKSWTFSKGDIITEIGGVAVDLEITEVRPGAFLNGNSNLILLFFKTRIDTNPKLRG